MVKKFAKKVVTAFMAVVMTATSLSSLATSISAAEAHPEYKVSLRQQDNGNIAFGDDASATERYASEGTKVPLVIHAEEGYEFQSFTVTDTTGSAVDVGTVIQGFVLDMPAQDIIVSADFAEMPSEELIAFTEGMEEEITSEITDDGDYEDDLSETDVMEASSEIIPEEPEDAETAEPEATETASDDSETVNENPDSEEISEVVSEPATDDQEPDQEEPAEEKDTMYLYIQVSGEGGSVLVQDENGTTILRSSDGQLVSDSQNPDMLAVDPEYGLILESEEAAEVALSIIPDDGYKISEYRVLSDAGGEQSENVQDSEELHRTVTFTTGRQFIQIGFENDDPYFISDDFDYAPYYAMDFSSLKVLVGTSNPEIFEDRDIPETAFHDVYLLRFEDVETAVKAYAYYEQNAEFVCIDPVYDGEGFQIALIDTGAAGAAKSVSVVGSDPQDNSGHGSQMLQMIYEQNPTASVLSVKALDSEGYGSMKSVSTAILYAAYQNVSMIVLPMSAPAGADDGAVAMAINAALANGITVVGAAGNNGADASGYIPGNLEGAIIVGAVDETGTLHFNSNYGATVDYHVVAGSTSEAAAKMAGWISLHGIYEIPEVLNQGLIFDTGYRAEDSEEPSEPADETEEEVPAEDSQESTDVISPEITEHEVGEEALPYKEHIADSVDEEYAGDDDSDLIPVDRLLVKHTFVDKNRMPENDYTIDGLFRDDDQDGVSEYLDAFLGQKLSYITLYTKEGSDYMFGYVDTLSSDDAYVSDYLVAWNNDFGMVMKDYSYDQENGIVYIPLKYQTEREIAILAEPEVNLQMQLLYVSEVGTDAPASKVNVIISDVEGKELLNGYVQQSIYDDMIQISLVNDENARLFDGYIQKVTINGVRTEKYKYDEESGMLLISEVSSSAIDAIELTVGPNPRDEQGKNFSAASGTYVFNGGGKLSVEGDLSQGATTVFSGTQVMYNFGTGTYQSSGLYHAYGNGYQDDPTTAGVQAPIVQAAISGGLVDIGDLTSRSGFTTNYWNVYIPAGTYAFTTPSGETVNVTIPEDIWQGLACTHVGISISNGQYYIFESYMPGGTAASHPSEVWGYIDTSAAQPYQVSLNPAFQSAGTITGGMTDSQGYYWYNAPVAASIVATDEDAGVLYLSVAVATAGSQSGTGVVAIPFEPEDKYGSIQIEKILDTAGLTAEAAAVIRNSSAYSVAGAQYTIYTDAACTQKYGTEVLTIAANDSTGMEGSSNVISNVPVGTYYIKETQAGSGLNLDTAVYSVTITKENCETTQKPSSKSKDTPISGSLQIEKILDTNGLTANAVTLIQNSAAYSVAGAQYTVYTDSACTQQYGTQVLTITASDNTGMSGASNVISNVPFGTYYIKETKAANNLTMDTAVYTVSINASNYATTQKPSSKSKDAPETGSVALSKVSANPGYTNGNPLYSLKDAKYGIYTDRACTNLFAEAYTDANGNFKVDNVPFGTYYIKELTASMGYGLALCNTVGGAEIHQVTLTRNDKDKSITCQEPADADPIAVLVQKIDKETGKPYAVGGATFEGAEYTVKYYMNYDYSGTPDRTWVFVTDKNGYAYLDTISLKSGSDDLYVSANGTFIIPRGSFTIQETKAPKGYAIDPTTYRYQVNGSAISYDGNDSGVHPISTTPELSLDKGQNSEEQVYRGNFEFKKVLEGSERIANALFEVTNTTTGETHYIVTDPNGVYNSQMFSKNNGNDAAVTKNADGTYTVDESALSYENNVWFSMDKEGNTASPNQNYASYPYGSYTFKEIETSANEGLKMITFTGTVYREGFYLNDQETYDLGTKDDSPEGTPDIHTIARDKEELDKMIDVDDSECDVIDKVSYSNLEKGETYILEGKVWDKTNGDFYKDASGAEYVVRKTFTATDRSGYTEVTFDLSADILKEMETKSIVIFEWLYKGDELLVTHADPDDQDQGIVVVQPPAISTTLADSIDGQHDALASKGMVLNDTVAYKNLKIGRTYRLDGVLMDKATGKPAKDDNGEQITATTTFRAEAEEGTVVLAFTFDGETLANHTVVAFESLYWRNIEQAEHKDLNDEGQTLYIPEISTTLKDSVDRDDDALAAEDIVLIDTVAYSNLIPGKEYVMKGVLRDKKTGEKALDDDGNEITSQVTFTPDEANGEIELAFRFSGINLAGESVVAFETLERGGKEVAVHADIDDDDQTVDIPKIETTLADVVDGEHDALAAETVTLVDTVAYTNLIVGRTYVMKGILMDQETGEAILDDGGNQIMAQETFTAQSKDGSVDLTFIFPGITLAGKSVVAFEELYRNDKKVAVHTDIEDESQTVHIPEIGTTLVDIVDGDKDALAAEDITLVDTVTYKNLIVGKTYTVTGKLYDQETGEPALDDNGDEITSEATFEAETADGSVEITFAFSGVSLAGHSVVAFEELYRDGKLVAVHADIEDRGQTVDIPKIETTLADPIDAGHDTVAKENIQLVDTVEYTNLIPGREYTLTGILMDQETGEEMLDDDGNTITAGATFTPDTADGSIDIIFVFNGVTLAGKSVVAFETLFREGKKVAVHTDIEDESQTVDIPEIGTTLKDEIDGGKDALAAEDITLVDTVDYKNLKPGTEYRMHGILMDQETGEPALDDNGNIIESEATFIPEEREGFVDISFTFSGVTLEGHTVVAFERLYREGKLIALHCEIDDFDQANWIPEIRTTLEDSVDGEKDAYATQNIRLVDTVVYQNLLEGKEYTVVGTLHDKETGKPALDDEGSVITAETTFVAEEANGSVEVVFEFSGVNLAGRTVVAFEDLYREGKKVAVHADLNDEDQTVYLPKIRTTLTDAQTKLHNTLKQDVVTLIDTVSYENLIVGREYVLKGVLMDKTSGKAILNKDGSEASATVKFVAESKSGTIDLTFKLDKIPDDGLTAVAFETLYRTGAEGTDKPVADHKDLEDMDQTVSVPEIGTTLTTKTGLKSVNYLNTITLFDEIKYTNLRPGATYKVQGKLMDKATGLAIKDASGKEVTSEAEFTPDSSSGSFNLAFKFECGETRPSAIVAFEYVYEGVTLIAEHEDLKDEDQTVYTMVLRTTALNNLGTKQFEAAATNKVLDRVDYKGLEPGRTYTLFGTLVEQETGNRIQYQGKDLTGKTTFTPESVDGQVIVEIEVPAGTFVGTAVVFEQLLDGKNGNILCVHEDVDDEAQTVYFAEAKTNAVNKADGSKQANLAAEVTIVDTVSFKGLEPGREYEVTATLMNKSTGRVVTSLRVPVTSTQTFTPDKTDGIMEMLITVPQRTVKGDTVCFEVIRDKETGGVVCRHEDLDDQDQTVTFYSTSTPVTPRTGDETNMLMWAAIAAGAVAIIVALLLVMKKRKGRS